MNGNVLVMAKSPVPGRVKTRLCPPYSPEQAAAIAAAALEDTLRAAAACRADRRVIALDGAPGPWLPPGFEIIAQRGDTLAERLANAWADTGPCGIQIAMDTPQVTSGQLDVALAQLLSVGPTAVIGHAPDGGWWLIGLKDADPHAVFAGIPTSTSLTGARQEQRLRTLGYQVALGSSLRDIDTYSDLAAVAAQAPGTRTATLARHFGPGRFAGRSAA